eukprot:TRINITY_DN67474_c3_g1_i9.p1 TRINITY_DN67474_c3_g1~~TRINITY_DN67474_c3_g1_i9.p1  ORF type:complete len:485 (+),score=163.34 TRINITY_DN67474_c3_g1_i9:152-1606(+)
MCCGAIYWAQRVSHVVYGCSHGTLNDIVAQAAASTSSSSPSSSSSTSPSVADGQQGDGENSEHKVQGVAMTIPAKEIFERSGLPHVQVIGPILEDECAAVHREFWPAFFSGAHDKQGSQSVDAASSSSSSSSVSSSTDKPTIPRFHHRQHFDTRPELIKLRTSAIHGVHKVSTGTQRRCALCKFTLDQTGTNIVPDEPLRNGDDQAKSGRSSKGKGRAVVHGPRPTSQCLTCSDASMRRYVSLCTQPFGDHQQSCWEAWHDPLRERLPRVEEWSLPHLSAMQKQTAAAGSKRRGGAARVGGHGTGKRKRSSDDNHHVAMPRMQLTQASALGVSMSPMVGAQVPGADAAALAAVNVVNDDDARYLMPTTVHSHHQLLLHHHHLSQRHRHQGRDNDDHSHSVTVDNGVVAHAAKRRRPNSNNGNGASGDNDTDAADSADSRQHQPYGTVLFLQQRNAMWAPQLVHTHRASTPDETVKNNDNDDNSS